MSKLAFNLPLNSTSLGQVSFSILREVFKRKLDIHLFPIGGVDISSQNQDQDFLSWLQNAILTSVKEHNKNTPIFKLWHFNGSLESYSNKQVLLSFYEVDSPTATEINIIKNNEKVLLSSNYAVSIFKSCVLSVVREMAESVPAQRGRGATRKLGGVLRHDECKVENGSL